MGTTCAPDSLLALSKLQSLEIDVQRQQGAEYLISHLTRLSSLRRLAIQDYTSPPTNLKHSLTPEGWQQVCR